MTDERIRRESVSDQVFARLRDRILSSALEPGAELTAERDLAEQYGVNRHAVREALKRLQQARLVEVSHGGRTRVLDWRQNAGLDLAMHLARTGDVLRVENLQRDMLEMRACIGADAARLCAGRGSDADLAAIAGAAARYGTEGEDLGALGAADIAWWRLIIRGSGNVAYLLAFNSLVGSDLAVGRVPSDHRAEELLDVAAHRRLAGLISERRAADAERAARELLSRSVPALPERAR
ncbi:FadR/GntR family transcriptional regulator [Planomonospora venezuelensis]|uniref:DNA-binding FadR family transcriptional regulator n=1 Tax=Planomonospora venezuelensis TaxID=1999 RepID=A0A841D1G0_PLAVE|nr:GntR family transcriptional regulator [Planomonospora venezuelensis]MBB5963570.1 DNA-binding FadR family transcriptional regulator [Planomonospora venezuelensis]GIN02089.1 GntR family transcriptional regulator [Planomonospora venezuelensis]